MGLEAKIMLRARAGDFVLVPPGVAHGFGNPEGGPP